MQKLIYNKETNKITFRNYEYDFKGYEKEEFNENSLFFILEEQYTNFLWDDISINDKVFSSLTELIDFLDSIILDKPKLSLG